MSLLVLILSSLSSFLGQLFVSNVLQLNQLAFRCYVFLHIVPDFSCHGYRHTITGFLKISHLSCQRSPAFRVVAAHQKQIKNKQSA